MIPPILHRTVPMLTTPEVEAWWSHAFELLPGWDLRTWRDPLDPADFPLTAGHWWRCTSGAQMAGLVRLEVLWHHGGVYLDSDVELYRPLDSLLGADVFACWQDAKIVPDAVIGAAAEHPAILECIDLAIARLDEGAHRSGPDVTTDVLHARSDVCLLLPPGSFYPYAHTERHRRSEDHQTSQPWAFGAHHWHASWVEHRHDSQTRRRRR